MLLARQREGRLKHKAVDVVMHFKIRLPVLYFLFLKIWCHIGHLDIGIFGIQILRVYLYEHRVVKERVVSLRYFGKKGWELSVPSAGMRGLPLLPYRKMGIISSYKSTCLACGGGRIGASWLSSRGSSKHKLAFPALSSETLFY